ncbi:MULTISPECIES: hypothetical protein [Lactobacillus]|uniref:Uncharacterized protein n=1 Tax=Lactobacillus xujianguonis TaxID=2495899 RepID=A0A437SVH2_9LACO|nr:MULTISPECIES: hypothetical protein [Lactobacillus]RVU70921.1 hypothetical protein EJK17_05030 [Lactobacillus xujianguonis]RVU73553.1 hypothetical protein EJK20_07495 [Lactobacillus xujianguonis]
MKINLQDLTEKIENQDYLQDLETVKYGDISKSKTKLKGYAEKMIKETVTGIKHNSLVQVQLAVAGQRPVTFALETNIINLPYSNYKKVANFFDEGPEYPVNVYFETISDYINVSKFRIDELAKDSELVADPDKYVDLLTDAMVEKLKVVREYQKPEPKPAAKKTTTKTTKKKSTAKKRTTKKK